MSERPTLTTTAGAPAANNQNSITAGHARSASHGGLSAHREARAPEPRAHSRAHCARQGLGRFRRVDDHPRHLEIHPGEVPAAGRQDGHAGAVFDGCRRARRGRRRARCARLCLEVLYWRRQLGPGGQQHAGVLRARRLQVSRLHPYAKTPPARQYALAHGDVGFLVAIPRKSAPSHHPDVGSGTADLADAHERVWLANLFADQRQE